MLLARRGQHWVSAVRVGDEITVDDVAIADSASIAALVFDALESIHHAEPAAINAVNVPLEEMLEVTKAWQSRDSTCSPAETCAGWASAPRPSPRSARRCRTRRAEAAVYARQYRDDDKAPSASVLSLKDGSGGRIAMYQQARTAGSSEAWLAICPGHPAAGTSRREDCFGNTSLRRVEDSQQSLTDCTEISAHKAGFHRTCGRMRTRHIL